MLDFRNFYPLHTNTKIHLRTTYYDNYILPVISEAVAQ